MPIPTPRPGETEGAFMARCVPALRSEDPDKQDEQVAAICFSRFAEAYRKKKRKKESVPSALNCDPLDLSADEVNAGGAALLHGWAHRLWSAGVRGPGVIEAHLDAISVGQAHGLSHEHCDDLDAVDMDYGLTESVSTVRAISSRLKERGIGKRIGKKTYAHRSAFSQEDHAALADFAIPGGFAWDVVKLHEDTGAVTFIHSPDFDTADEPTVGDSILVRRPGAAPSVLRAGQDPWIYHHKWQFVAPSYDGFDVGASKARSDAWTGLADVDRSRIGKRSYWEANVVPRITEARLTEAAEVLTDADRDLVAQAMGHRTAIARTEPSKPLRFYEANGLIVGDVLDYGGGKDVHDYTRWDPHFAPDPAPLKQRYDTVLCNYVLNVTPTESLRCQIMSAIRGLLRDGGRALVSCWQKQADDVKTSTSFQCGWDATRWQQFFEANGWDVESLRMPGGMAWSLTPVVPGAADVPR